MTEQTDRELLEMAAKAAGYDIQPHPNRRSCRDLFFLCNNRNWNPLADDGDALRLAVKLNLWEAVRLAHRLVSDTVDLYAATRRAIVRAAAAIGEAMQ